VAVLLEQHAAELDREHRKFKTLFDSSRDAVMILTAGTITEYNQRALDWFDQLGAGAPAGRRLEELARHGTPGETTLPPARLDEALAGPDGGTVEWVLRDRRGEPLHAELTLTPLPGSGPDQHQLVVRDVTARVVEFRRVSHDAAHDALTGIPNRREFERRAGLAVRAAVRDGARHVLCFLDLDGFKPVNDRAGHAAGDELLRQVATRLRAHARSGDLLARIGGDEFGLLLEDCPLDHGAQIVRAIIRDIGAMPFHAAGQDFRVGVSIGLAAITRDTPGLEALMAAADQACYAAKRDPTHLVLAHSG
jgi:Amt family ammonium transporter